MTAVLPANCSTKNRRRTREFYPKHKHKNEDEQNMDYGDPAAPFRQGETEGKDAGLRRLHPALQGLSCAVKAGANQRQAGKTLALQNQPKMSLTLSKREEPRSAGVFSTFMRAASCLE